MKARDIEVAVANHFDYRRNLIVPNVWWGMGLNHEADLLILSQAGYATEVEIKISKSDLLRDAKKETGHRSDKVKALFFAVPDCLAEYALSHIPEEAGLLKVKEMAPGKYKAVLVKAPKLRSNSRGFRADERYQLARLGLLRYWTLRGEYFKGEEIKAEA